MRASRDGRRSPDRQRTSHISLTTNEVVDDVVRKWGSSVWGGDSGESDDLEAFWSELRYKVSAVKTALCDSAGMHVATHHAMPYEVDFLVRILLCDHFGENGCSIFDRCCSRYTGNQDVDAVRLEHLAYATPVGNLQTAIDELTSSYLRVRWKTRRTCAHQVLTWWH